MADIKRTDGRVDGELLATGGIPVIAGAVAAHNGWDVNEVLGLVTAGFGVLGSGFSVFRRWFR